jgi:pimeloyl-ACP methyl ester carboxylesterase
VRRANVIGGVLGAAAAITAAGLAAERYVVRQRRNRSDEPPQDFPALDPDRAVVVRTEDGVALHVEEVGPLDAPVTVVFVHGYALSLEAFYFQRRDLAERFGSDVRLVFYDLRSHGRSGASVPEGATMEQLGRDLYAVLADRVPRGPIVLVGHSMGAMAIQHFAASFPEMISGAQPVPRRSRSAGRVVGVVQIATSAGGLGQVSLGLPALFGRLQGTLTGALLRSARKRANLVESGRRLGSDIAWLITRRLSFGDRAIRPEVVDFLHRIISATPIVAIADFHPALVHHDGHGGLEALQHADGLIVAGSVDVMTPLSHSRRLAEELPKADLLVLDGAGHVVLMERTDEVDAAIGDLVERALSGSRRTRRRR